MPIPAFLTQVIFDFTATVAVTGGSGGTVALSTSQYFYLLSNKTSSGNGQSLLTALGTALSTADGTATFTCKLTSDFRINITHNAGATKTITLSSRLGEMLGWYFQGSGSGATLVPPGVSGASGLTPLWFWTPDMTVSGTGPEMFDPLVNHGVLSSAGAGHRAPDGTASYVANGTQVDAELIFNGVQPYYRAHPPYVQDTHTNKDFVTWWSYGIRIGRRILYWRDRSQLVSVAAVTGATSNNIPKYVEYNPTDEARARPLITATNPPGLVYWDVRLPFWLSDRAGAVFS